MLVASWGLPERWYPRGDLNDQIDGFRAYLYRADEMEQVLDVGAATRAEFPIPADGGEYEVHVTSYSDEFSEGPASIHTFSQADGPKLELIDHWSDGWRHVCDLQWELPSVARWFIAGGAAPYTLRVTGGQTVSTNEHAGYIKLACDARLESDASVAEVTVIDVYGRPDTQQVAAVSDDLVGMLAEYYADRYTRWPVDGLPFSVEGLAFDGVSIHREACGSAGISTPTGSISVSGGLRRRTSCDGEKQDRRAGSTAKSMTSTGTGQSRPSGGSGISLPTPSTRCRSRPTGRKRI